MPPKKTLTTSITTTTTPKDAPPPIVIPSETPSIEEEPVDVPSNVPVVAPKKRAPRTKKAPEPVLEDATDDVTKTVVAKKRNMSAVSSDFVSALHQQLPSELQQSLKIKEVKEIAETFIKTLVDKVKNGETVSFTNHMTFKRQVRGPRTYTNLKTQEPIEKAPHYVLSMQVKPALKRAFDDVEVVVEPKNAPVDV